MCTESNLRNEITGRYSINLLQAAFKKSINCPKLHLPRSPPQMRDPPLAITRKARHKPQLCKKNTRLKFIIRLLHSMIITHSRRLGMLPQLRSIIRLKPKEILLMNIIRHHKFSNRNLWLKRIWVPSANYYLYRNIRRSRFIGSAA